MGIRANAPHNDYLIELVRATLLHTELPPMPADCDLEALSALIQSQQIVSLVYPEICRHPHLQSVRTALERRNMMQIPKVINQDLEIQKWLDAAEAAGVDCIPLKGYWLRQLYPAPIMRSMTDFDVLLRQLDRDTINPWMESLGYKVKEEEEIDYHDSFSKEPWMYMELHRNLTLDAPGRDAWESRIWNNAVALPGRKHIFRMSWEDFYVFHLIHMHKHFMARGSGMKGIIDIYVFMQAHGKELDRQYLDQELKAHKLDAYAAYMEKLANIWLGDGESDDDSRLVTDYLAGCGMFGNNETRRAICISQGSGNLAFNKFRYRMQILFPGVNKMKQRFPSVAKVPFLLPFYWIARFFQSVFIKHKSASLLNFDHIDDQKYTEMNRIFTITGTK